MDSGYIGEVSASSITWSLALLHSARPRAWRVSISGQPPSYLYNSVVYEEYFEDTVDFQALSSHRFDALARC
jgi:hypothetical protein